MCDMASEARNTSTHAETTTDDKALVEFFASRCRGTEECSVPHEALDRLFSRVEAAEKRAELTEGGEENWPLHDVLSRLADFADDRLTRKDYDGHGHEALRICVDRARAILSARGRR